MNQLSNAITEDKVLVRGARQLLTMQDSANPRRGRSLGELSIIPDGAVLIRGGAIIQVGTSRRVENLKDARGAREIDATGRVVMPGLVDAGAQLRMQPRLDAYESMLRGAAEPQAAEGIPPLRAASAHRLEGHARKLIESLVRHGTTTIGAKSSGPEPAEDLKMLRMLSRLQGRPLDIVTSYLGANHIPLEFTNNATGYLESLARNTLFMIARRKLAAFVGIECGPGLFGNKPLLEYLKQARNLGLAVEILPGCEMAARLALEAGAISLHIGQALPAELEALAASPTIAVLAPALGLYHEPRRFASARALIDSGVAVALASAFGPDSSPAYNMQTVISLACMEMHLTPAEAICAATINAAHALHCANRLGCLEPGKQADLLLLNIEDYRELPYYFGTNHVNLVVKKGRTIYHEGSVSP